MILEGLLTTLDTAGQLNVAPMGPRVLIPGQRFELRPFRTSRTCQNLCEQPTAVLHVTDDVGLIARAALDGLDPLPAHHAAPEIRGRILDDCCQWFALRIESLDTSSERTSMIAAVVASGVQRPFFGFNRAKHAVLEATILATRLHLLPPAEIDRQLSLWRPAVDKTAGTAEQAAWEYVCDYIARHRAAVGA